jgi:hypothetical protein
MPKRGFEEKKKEIGEYLERRRIDERDQYKDPRQIPLKEKRDTPEREYIERGRSASDHNKYGNPREHPLENDESYVNERENPSSKNSGERKNLQQGLLENIVNSAANTAAEHLSQKRPRFSKSFILRYLDPQAIAKYVQKMTPYLEQGKKSSNQVYRDIAKHIISGDFLNETGKRMIIEHGLEKEATEYLGVKGAKELVEGERYLDKAMSAFRDIYELIKSNEDYANHMPELSKAVTTLYELGFRDASLTALKSQLPRDKYIAAKLGMTQVARQAGEYAKKTIESYLPQTLAASIMALVGIGVLFGVSVINKNAITTTGNVIGFSNNAISSSSILALFFGAASLIMGVYLFIRKKPKRKQKKI